MEWWGRWSDVIYFRKLRFGKTALIWPNYRYIEHSACEIQPNDHGNIKQFLPAAFCLPAWSFTLILPLSRTLALSLAKPPPPLTRTLWIVCTHLESSLSLSLSRSTSLTLRQGKIRSSHVEAAKKRTTGLQTKRHHREAEREGVTELDRERESALEGVQSQTICPLSFVYARFVAITLLIRGISRVTRLAPKGFWLCQLTTVQVRPFSANEYC